ncbi:MAG: acetate kinase [Minisyncoccota bacterium]
MKILTVNVGSESKKYSSFENDMGIWSVTIEQKDGQLGEEKLNDQFDVIAFRVVAPGNFFREHKVIDEEFLTQLESARIKAPLHVERLLSEIKFFRAKFPNVKMVAISDSAFHFTLPDYVRLYSLPINDTKEFDIEHFGYHGISLSSIVEILKSRGLLPEKVIICHLGGGSSITALKNGESIDTSMGFTPLSGLTMATRVGEIDPGALVYLSEVKNLHGEKFEEYLANQCGFFGFAGTPSMKQLLAQEAMDEKSALVIKMFVYQVQKYIGAYAVALGGLDLLVFSGGIGEVSEPIRSKILAGLGALGQNVLVVPTNESAEMVRLAKNL